MSQDNQITLRGFVAIDPKFFVTTRTGTEVAEVRLGSTHRWLDRNTGEWQESEPTFYTVKCWRKLALNVKSSLHKGDRVLVRGKFNTRTWTDEQQHRRVDVEVEADSIGHDLLYGVSIFNRTHTARDVTQTLANGEIARAGLDGSDSAVEANGVGADDLPPVPGESYGYPRDDRDDNAMSNAGEPFPPGTPEEQDPDEEDSEEAIVGAPSEVAVATPF